MPEQPVTYPTLEAFYGANPQRQRSGELDYGVWWRDEAGAVYRISLVVRTGEVYAFCFTTWPPTQGKVEVLAALPHDGTDIAGDLGARDRYQRHPAAAAAARLLEGWAEVCGQPYSLAWVRGRLSQAEAVA